MKTKKVKRTISKDRNAAKIADPLADTESGRDLVTYHFTSEGFKNLPLEMRRHPHVSLDDYHVILIRQHPRRPHPHLMGKAAFAINVDRGHYVIRPLAAGHRVHPDDLVQLKKQLDKYRGSGAKRERQELAVGRVHQGSLPRTGDHSAFKLANELAAMLESLFPKTFTVDTVEKETNTIQIRNIVRDETVVTLDVEEKERGWEVSVSTSSIPGNATYDTRPSLYRGISRMATEYLLQQQPVYQNAAAVQHTLTREQVLRALCDGVNDDNTVSWLLSDPKQIQRMTLRADGGIDLVIDLSK